MLIRNASGGYEQQEHQATPPTPTGETLLILDRGHGKSMRIARESYEGNPFISLRVWENGFPTKSGTSLRLRELTEVLEVLGQLDESGQGTPVVRSGGAESRSTPPRLDDQPRYVPPRHPRPGRFDPSKPRPTPSPTVTPLPSDDEDIAF